MTIIGLLLDRALQSRRTAAVTRTRTARRQRDASHQSNEETDLGMDYTLIDERGERVGKIPAAEKEPVLGKHAPTFYLERDPK